MTFKKLLCASLAGCMIVPALVACGGSGGESTAATTAQQAGETAAQTTAVTSYSRENTPDTLPADLDFKGETVNVLFPESYNGTQTMVDWYEEDNGDIISAAVYARRIAVEERLNVKYKVNYDFAVEKFLDPIRQDVASGSGAYDVCWGAQAKIAQLVVENMYRDMSGAKYLDFEQPWWNTEYMDEITINARRYLLAGDVSLSMFSYSSCIYVNKTQFNTVTGEKADDLYTTVLDKKWTMDKLSEYCAISYKDTNGNGTRDDNDTYGIATLASSDTDHYTIDAGIRFTERDAKGIPQICINNEKTIAYAEKLYKHLFENTGVLLVASTQNSLNVTIPNKMMNNEFTFMYGWLYSANLLRDMKEDYGILPFPLYEEGDDYKALVHDAAHLVCVPVSCKKVDAVAATLEATAAENYRTVTPAYYEMALKSKYTRDSMSGQIIDMIHDATTTDFAYVYNYILSNLGIMMRKMMSARTGDFASFYATNRDAYQASLNDLIAAFQKIE